MAYQMSPPAQQPLKPSPQPYPPYQAAGSPAPPPFAQPPAKRQRISPDPRSPAGGSPMYAQSPMHYANPHGPPSASPLPYSPQSFVGSPQNPFNTPQPYSPPVHWSVQQPAPPQRPTQISPPLSTNSMPPPPRPNKEDKDERMGVEDIGDSLFGSGINLKDEENYLHSTWNNRQNESFATNQSTSFSSNTMSPNGSFNLLTQGTWFGTQGESGVFARSKGQPQSQDDIENEMKKKREDAARRRAEKDQFHLNNQFLLTNCLRHRMHQRANQEGVRLNVEGVYVRNPEPDRVHTVINADGTEGIVSAAVKPEAMIEQGAPYDHIMTLVCLATQERLRGLVDEAYGLARARRYGDHGRVVPPEFSDIATGEGQQSQETVVPESVTGSQWDRAQDSVTGMVNGDSQVNGARSTPTPQLQPTISFQGTLNQKLRDLTDRDTQAEKERIRKREARKRQAENAAEDTPAATPADERASEPVAAAAPMKVSKKEQNKKAKEAQASTEAQAFNQSNQTAAMMALGGKKNRYSWMSGGAANMPTNRFAKPNGGTATPKAAEPVKAPADGTKKDEEKKKLPTWGDWCEDDVHGQGVQLRDWILVLERDGREKKALQQALNKLS